MGRHVVVVGAGVTGLLTAVRCARAGLRVTVLDSGPVPNPAATSHDEHRAIRALDPGDVAATRASAVLHRRWLELESLLGKRFYRRVGVVTGWPADAVGAALEVAAEAGVPVSAVAPEKYPHLRFPAGSAGLLEVDAGVLLADRVLDAAVRWLREQPLVVLRPGCAVREVDVDAAAVVTADGLTVRGDAVVVAAGPWSGGLVDVPTVLHRQVTVYLRPPDDLAHWWEGAPSAGRIGDDGRAWLWPPGDGTQLKISSATLCREVEAVGEDAEAWTGRLALSSVLADWERYTVTGSRTCHYAVDPVTGGGEVVRIGPSTWARAASGGDGFRTAPVVAERIAEEVGT
ncbi:glycine/D-amino acid oxidase-like deaminating enzyme [Saccharothrix saharensis]|uniref:Glycine/D-amino acid oxidase-like deaminating enzyme n=1 Tax=Saccharothrix saharensis TaxID=571190 RepID=A0A543JAK1_9PSEU|nr:FAD-dependent oxidoreductase [Saccharothrix saharensis]TQM79852.1 glycine/D-amino acid oxidase-like deaminating enzyme [Saccharothrix saharensis]